MYLHKKSLKQKEVIKISAKCTSLDGIVEITRRHIDILKRFLKDLSPKKKLSNAGCFKELRFIKLLE